MRYVKTVVPGFEELGLLEQIRRIAEAVEKRQAAFLRAEILDRDSQLLATGEATPRSEGAHQIFHIDNPRDADTLESHAAILRRRL